MFVICGLGFANGLDFINPESGLVRPHEWINGMAQGAPHDLQNSAAQLLQEENLLSVPKSYYKSQTLKAEVILNKRSLMMTVSLNSIKVHQVLRR